MNRNWSRRSVIGGVGALGVASGSWAQSGAYPSRPIRLISPFSPGGATDILSRLLAERMSINLGQPVVVEARPGANTIIGAEATARSAPDGYSFMITTNSTHTNNPFLYRSLPYDPLRSFAPIMLISIGSVLLTASGTAEYDDLKGFLAWGKAQVRPIGYGSWGVASLAHLAGAMLSRQSGLPMEHVPYRGEQAALTDLVSNRLDSTFASPVGAVPFAQVRRIKPLAMVGRGRSPAMPDVPTFAEQGIAGLDVAPFVAAWAPAQTPRAIIDRLNAALLAAVGENEVRQRMLEQGQDPVASSPDELAETVGRDLPRWQSLIELSGARLD
jgi:tripartite-type tricarboxylate transporter receptor subunit TctC